ncbi:cytochrome P450 [Solihabitans fulvus]|uniref:Cytochrome P450 n=1 Tax=Solihabitans fulvus TaxID=1892852 RepID=A0A5B2W8Y2_9PSEU|nr:cytochrome P450 [Solihabitans fulvus]KAA2247288.1 cytochrome P450 [Solihabitans fulvus]
MTFTIEPISYPFGDGKGLELEPEYGRLRDTATAPVRIQMPYGDQAWLVTRYHDAKKVLVDPRFSRSLAIGPGVPRVMPEPPEPPTPEGILSMDAPEHTRIRGIAGAAFTTRRVEDLRRSTEEIANRLVDKLETLGSPVDLVEHLALPLPVTVICELLGVPVADQDQFGYWSTAFLSAASMSRSEIQHCREQFFDYLAELFGRRRAEPIDDLISVLVMANDEYGRLTEDELTMLMINLLMAGHETSATQIPNMVYTLDRHRDQWDLLLRRPDLVPRAVEELNRYIPISVTSSYPRVATVDIEVGGITVRAGESVLVSMVAANRDPAVFPDPERFDVTREHNPHIGFGHGAHHCLGSQLARLELQVTLDTFLRRMPNLRVAVPEEDLAWRQGHLLRGFLELPVAW